MPGVGAPFAGVGLQFGAEHMADQIVEQLLVVDQCHFRNRHLGAWCLTRLHFVHGPLVVEVGHAIVDVQVGHHVTHERIIFKFKVAHHCVDAGHHRDFSATATRADRCPFVHEGGESHTPTRVHVTQAVRVGHMHFVEEHFIETCPTSHLAKWTNLDAWRIHIHQETSEAFVLGQARVGTTDDFTDVAVMSTRGPHFLPGDHPLVTVTLGLGLQRRQIATSTWFAEQLAADDVGAPHCT